MHIVTLTTLFIKLHLTKYMLKYIILLVSLYYCIQLNYNRSFMDTLYMHINSPDNTIRK